MFGLGYYKYSFENYCNENKDVALGDESEKIFLNLKGYKENNERSELIQFLHYVKNSKSANAKGYSRLEELDGYFRNLVESREVEEKYMRTDWVAYEAEQKGREEGREEGIRALIETCRELGASDSIIVEKIVEKYKIPYDKASEYLKGM